MAVTSSVPRTSRGREQGLGLPGGRGVLVDEHNDALWDRRSQLYRGLEGTIRG
jgi:hypothetical protein